MSIHDSITEQMNPMFTAFMADADTRKVLLEAMEDAQRIIEERDRKTMRPTVKVDGAEDVVFDTMAQALQYVSRKFITGTIETSFDTFEVVKGKGVPKRFSKKRLLPLLKQTGYIENDGQVSFEAYGRDVRAYILVKTMQNRQSLEAMLRMLGQTVNANYYPGNPVVEVGVSYFKTGRNDF